jgi:X-X-X-Leu-X-X-Gly heptad repeat protein
MADSSNEVVGIVLDVDDAKLRAATSKVETAVKEMRQNVEAEMRALNESISIIPAEGINKLAEQLGVLKNAFSGAKVDSSFVDAIKSMNNASKLSGEDIQKLVESLTAVRSQMSSSSGASGVSADMKELLSSTQNTVASLADVAKEISNLSVSIQNWKVKISEAASASSSAVPDVQKLAAVLQTLDPSKMNIAQLTAYINDLQTALRTVGAPSQEIQNAFVSAKKTLEEFRAVAEKSGEPALGLDAVRELNALYKERLSLEKEIASVSNKQQVDSAKNGVISESSKIYLEELKSSLDYLDEKIEDTKQRLLGLGETTISNYNEKSFLAQAKAAQKLEDALLKLQQSMAKSNMTQQSKDYTNYKSLSSQLLQAEKALQGFQEAMAKYPGTDIFTKAQEGAQKAQAQIDAITQKMQSLKQAYGDAAFTDVDNDYAIKKAQQSIQTYEQAEKEKTKIANREAQARRSAVQDEINNALQQERAKEIQRVREQIDSLDKSDKNYAENLSRLNAILANLINQKTASASATRKVTAEEARQAVLTAAQTGKLKDLINAYNLLHAAMNNTDPKSSEWNLLNKQLGQVKAQIDGVKKRMGELKEHHSKLLDTASQLTRKLALMFSVSAINGYIKKVVEVRAQFELQRIALGAILQDVEKANEVFKQVQGMALESPFSIMQLERATKQIAAFGVEADKLKPSIKMLADISAGLGVDIDRLILVYGHIKANNALQQLHVRQFTNAGFNIAGELAKYYTELEGKMVSVADVTDRIHKKMVSFADVEEVLQRVTSAGGMFYDMQRKQADSIWGQMQRIQDQMDLTLNSIGESNQSTIKSVLSTIRELIKSWRDYAGIIKTVAYGVTAWVSYRYVLGGVLSLGAKTVAMFKNVAAGISLVASSEKSAAAAATLFGVSLKSALVSTGVGALVVAFGYLLTKLFEVDGALEGLKEEMNNIGSDTVNSMKEAEGNFLSLSEKVRDSTLAYSERNQAMEDLKRIFGEILPQYMLEEEYLRSNADGFRDATEAIRDYYAAKEYSKKVSVIKESEVYQDLKNAVSNVFKELQGEDAFDEYVTKGTIENWVNSITEELASGKIKNSAEAMFKAIQALAEKHLKKGTYTFGFGDVEEETNKLKEQFESITLETVSTSDATKRMSKELEALPLQTVIDRANKYSKKIDEIKNKINAEINLYNRDAKFAGDDTNVQQARQKHIEDMQAKLAQLETIYESNVKEAINSKLASQIIDQFEEQFSKLKDTYELYGNLIDRKQVLERTSSGTEEETQKMSDLDKQIQEAKGSIKDLAEELGVELDPKMLETAGNVYQLQMNLHELKEMSLKQFADDATNDLGKIGMEALNQVIDLSTLAKKLNELAHAMGMEDLFPDYSDKKNENNTYAPFIDEQAAAENKRLQELEAQLKITDRVANKFNVDRNLMARLGKQEGETNANASKRLADLAKAYKKTLEWYNKLDSAQKEDYLSTQGTTEKQIKDNAELAKSIEYLSDIYKPYDDSKNKKSKGKDEISELWKNRLKALQDYYSKYDALKKNYSDTQALDISKKAFKKYFNELGMDIEKISSRGMNKSGAVSNVNSMLEQVRAIRPKLVDEFEKVASDYSVNIGLEVQTKGLDDLKTELDDMFDNYELSKTLTDLGLNIDLTYVVGGKSTTLDDVKSDISGMWKSMLVDEKLYGEEGVKVWQAYQKKLDGIEQKAQMERLKNYYKYSLEAMSERIQIEMKAANEISKVRASSEFDDATKELIIANQTKDKLKQLDELAWKEFTNSDLYIKLFDDIESASSRSINFILDRLNSLKSSLKNLPADQVKAIVNQINKLEEQQIAKNPFKGIADNLGTVLKSMTQRSKLEKQYQKDVLKEQQMQKGTDKYAYGTEQLKEQLKILKGKLGVDKNGVQIENDETRELEQIIKAREEEYQIMLKELLAQKKISQDEYDRLSQMDKSNSNLSSSFSKIAEGAQQLNSGMSDLLTGLDSLGLVSDSTQDFFDSASETLSGISTIFNGLSSIDITKPFSILTGTLSTVGGVFQTIGGLFGLGGGDKKKARKIKKLQSAIDALDKSYQKLSKSIEEAYSYDDYELGYDQAKKNLEEQIADYEQMIELEKSKKKTDDDAIESYQDAIDELNEELEELKSNRIEAMGGFGSSNYLSDAEEFVSAWLDAFKELGDGLDALQDEWQEYMENLFIKQAAMKKAGTLYSKAMEIIDNAIDSGKSGYDLEDAVALARNAADEASEELNNYLKALAGVFGISQEGENTLSELQQGISNITEEQAAAVEAYLNSIRFYVANNNTLLSELVESIKAQYTEKNNPSLTVLKEMRDYLQTISSNFSRVLDKSGSSWRVRIS